MSTYPGIGLEGIEKLTTRQYRALLEQAFNINRFRTTGELEYLSHDDKIKVIEDDYLRFKYG